MESFRLYRRLNSVIIPLRIFRIVEDRRKRNFSLDDYLSISIDPLDEEKEGKKKRISTRGRGFSMRKKGGEINVKKGRKKGSDFSRKTWRKGENDNVE